MCLTDGNKGCSFVKLLSTCVEDITRQDTEFFCALMITFTRYCYRIYISMLTDYAPASITILTEPSKRFGRPTIYHPKSAVGGGTSMATQTAPPLNIISI